MADLLSGHGLTIVGGPHQGILEVAAAANADIDADMSALRASPLVSFVGPAS